jgi:spermidine synthase
MMTRLIVPLALATTCVLGGLAQAQTRVLFEKESPYNRIVVTEDFRGLRTLYFDDGGVRQSVVKLGDPDHLELNYAKSMVAGLALIEAPKRVLVVGLGGGTIPSFLRHHYPKLYIDVVDIDPVVVDVARQFFGFRDFEDGRMRAFVSDGRRLIERCENRYDVIFLDAFGSDSIPYHLATREFLLAVRRALTAEGLALGNVWGRGSNPLYDDMLRTYQDVFDDVYVLDVRATGNKIVIGLQRERDVSLEEFTDLARKLGQARRFPHDLGEVVDYGYHHENVIDPEARVLTDKPAAKKAG